ncbi:alpha/beta fold hydrolase [Dyella sp.]|uniref:alpha/beta fold hydrolase n=1 Tax=Dyella sp. TaxID=1869338 RepID=UPI00284FCF2D|nr:alpha/beta fold hydrolase [Dyella sp.]MDR3447436.1 alpha/beta fold hydrolase [Dyella sp.]
MLRRDFLIHSGLLAAAAALQPLYAQDDTSRFRAFTSSEFHAARQFVQVGPDKVAFVEQGAGDAALFLHGYPLNGFQWRGSMARLASIRRCIAPDLRGLGYTDAPADADLSPHAQAAMIIALLDKLGVRDVDLISNDSATGIAQLIIASHPQRVRSWLATNGDVQTNSPPAALLPFLEKARRNEVSAWFEHHLTDNHFARSHDGIGNAYHDPDRVLTHDVIETYFRPLVSSPKRRQQGQQYGLAMFPNPLPAIEPALRQFQRPVRMVWARDNELFPDRWAHWLDQTFPHSRGIRFVNDAQLFFPEEQPELMAGEALALWRFE